jgi:hypothetical protein
MIAQAKNTPAVSLSVAQVGDDLDISPLSVSRLIVRGRLKATQLGTAGEWRVLPAELSRYIAAGVPDLHDVLLDGPGWLAPFAQPLGNFEQAIIDAAQQAIEADPVALERIAADESVPVEFVAPIDAVLAVARQPIPGQLAGVITLRERFGSWAALWLAEQLREYARQEIRKAFPVSRPAGRFYESPEAYAKFVAAAGVRLTAASISSVSWIPIEIDGTPTKRSVKIIMPVAALMTALGLRVSDVAELAF